MVSRSVITVDGLAGSGKSTLAKLLSEKLHFSHLNSGLLYRAVGYLALQEGINPNSEEALQAVLPRHSISLHSGAQGRTVVLLDGTDISARIQTPEVSEATSRASQYAVVRQALLEMQRQAFPGCPLVAEGRDMGTVVFPSAPLKFFIVADEKVRVARRLTQLIENSSDRSEQARRALEKQIAIEIAERDRRDTERSLAPTLAAADAVRVDNSVDELPVIVEKLVEIARQRGIVASA